MTNYERVLLKLGNDWLVVHGGFQPRFALYTDEGSVCSLQSGLGTWVLHPVTPKMKCNCGHLAPVEVLPYSNEARGSEA